MPTLQDISNAHVVSFCFDDGYRASSEAVAALFEKRGVAASFCVLTDPAATADEYIRAGDVGDFALWRTLARRGHEVMPHGDRHIHLGKVALPVAMQEVETALARFADGMGDEAPAEIVWHCAYGALPDALSPWLRTRVRAARATTDNRGCLPLAWPEEAFALDCGFPLPPDVAGDALRRVADLFAGPPEWLVLCFHGLEPEGWGPIAQADLERLLDDVLARGGAVAPPLQVISQLSARPT